MAKKRRGETWAMLGFLVNVARLMVTVFRCMDN
jgi:hypothetical protein